MSRLFANVAFNYSALNLNLLVANQTGFSLSDDTDALYNGVTYQDVAVFEYLTTDFRYGIFGGSDIEFNPGYTDVLSGTATGFLEYHWSAGSFMPRWGLEGFSYSASSFGDAIFSSTTSDDNLVFSSILSGNDDITMSASADRARGYAGNDTMRGNGGNDVLYGDGGTDKVYGHGGNDTLYGGSGNDLIVGGTGRDVMNGGSGVDRFDFNAVKETAVTSQRDVINAFDASDLIDVSSIDANTTVAGNQAFTFSRGKDFTGTFNGTGKLFYETDTHILWGNNDSDAKADFSIKVNFSGISNLTASDFVL